MLTAALLSFAPLFAPTRAPLTQAGSDPAAPKPRVLVVSGANNHDWKWTTPSLARMLERTGRFEVETTAAPGELLAPEGAAARYDAFVLDYNGPAWGEPAQENFLRRVRRGAGVVVVHGANNSGKDWPEYEHLVADLWREGTGHGRFHSFDVDVVDRDHPVTRSLPRIQSHPDELYHRLVRVEGTERRTLMSAFSDPETGGTGEREPMVLVGLYGKGRVFHTPLGHVWPGVVPSQASHRDPQFQGLMVRGTEWAIDGKVTDEERAPAQLTDAQIATGMRPLMSAETWQDAQESGAGAPDGWTFDGGLLHSAQGEGALRSVDTFGDFVLEFEWKGALAGEAALAYRTSGGQVLKYALTDAWAEAAAEPQHRAGALHGLSPAKELAPPVWGEFRRARIVARGRYVEHWLDGQLVASASLEGEDWDTALARAGVGEDARVSLSAPGHFVLDPRGDELWIRGMRVFTLDVPSAATVTANPRALFSGSSLDADWTRVGDALYELSGDLLIGRAGPRQLQSFLVSKAEYGDYEFEVELRIATLGNSGVQFRSHVEDGRLRGYQAEIDPTPRRWSAGIYDEGRRGWLDDLSDNPEAQAAFDLEGWNTYRIVCDGPHLRTWVNGVPAANLLDGADLAGSFAFQIHAGDDDMEIQWRGARIVEHGRHGWAPARAETSDAARVELAGADGLRARVLGDGARVRISFGDSAEDVVLDPTADKHWHSGGRNALVLLQAEDRYVVQLNDITVQRGSGTPVAMAVEGAQETIDWQRCR